MKRYLIFALTALLTGCGQQSSETSPEAEPKSPSAAKIAAERMTGQTAVKTYKHTKDVLVDVEASAAARNQSVKDLNKE